MSSSSPLFNDQYDWRISEGQIKLINDRILKLSKKETSTLIDFMEYLFYIRKAERDKREQK